jgi:hypothetical protein
VLGASAGIGGNVTAGNGALAQSTIATSATINSGSGGGGGASSYYSGNIFAGAGGSGIVIIRYPSYLAPATSTTGSPETYTTGGWRVYKFVASGTITF